MFCDLNVYVIESAPTLYARNKNRFFKTATAGTQGMQQSILGYDL